MGNRIKWLVVCRFFHGLLQFLAGTMVARTLGPVAYGTLGYAASLTALVSPVAQLGLHSILVQELANSPQDRDTVLGTAMGLQFLAGMVCLPAVALWAWTANPEEPQTAWVCLLHSTGLMFQAGELLQYRFHWEGKMKTAALASLAAGLAATGYKLFLVAARGKLEWFALAHTVEYGALGVLLLVAHGGKLRFSRKRAASLLKKGRYYIAAGLMLVVFHNTDRVMLTWMAGQQETGYYSAAMTCAGAAGFVYNAILDAARPEVLAAGKQREAMLVQVYRLVLGLAAAECAAMTLLAKPVVLLLFGGDYLPAAGVLRMLVWYLVFSYMGSARNLWILAEERHSCLWVINLVMAGGNVVLNGLLIPAFGAMGAAGASVLTQFLGNFLLGFFWKPLKENQSLLMQALGRRNNRGGNRN